MRFKTCIRARAVPISLEYLPLPSVDVLYHACFISYIRHLVPRLVSYHSASLESAYWIPDHILVFKHSSIRSYRWSLSISTLFQ